MRDVDSNPALHRLSQNAEIAPTTGSDPFGNLPAGSHRIFIVSLLVKNIGTKTITVVNWEYLQFEVNGKEPVKRYRVQSKRIIPPGELAEFTKEVEPKGKEHQALVTRIEYADGSFWQER
jgi:archaellum component FlaG (FlaF/FlaG flagellin family)